MNDVQNPLIPDAEERMLIARLDDLIAEAERGTTAVSAYLTPREAKWAARRLSSRLSAGTAVLWGGYPEAERVRAILLPDYVEGLCAREALSQNPAAALRAVGFDDLADTVEEAVTAVSVSGSGYRALDHRDYLGSILGLGVERDAIGDVLVADAPDTETTDRQPSAYPRACLYTSGRMADFLVTHLVRVATDAVHAVRIPPAEVCIPPRRLSPIRDTVASERLDCVVAALCNLSRDAAQTAIRRGLCEVDYEAVTACDRTLTPPAVIAVRGIGKFRVEAFDGENRKGRIRILAGKYI